MHTTLTCTRRALGAESGQGLCQECLSKQNAVHSRSLQMCRPRRQRFERIVIHQTDRRMNILKGRTLSRSRCPLGFEVTWPKAVAGLKRIPVIPANILPQHKACVGVWAISLPLPPPPLLLGRRVQAWHRLACKSWPIGMRPLLHVVMHLTITLIAQAVLENQPTFWFLRSHWGWRWMQGTVFSFTDNSFPN